MTEPEFDEDGYPTEATEQAIRGWPYTDANGALDFVASAWKWPDGGVRRELKPCEAEIVHAEDGDRFLRLATGGWSGNESLVSALEENHIVWALTWRLTARGGLHIFGYGYRMDGDAA